MSLTAYHAKYFAHDLTRRSVGGIDRLSMALFDASVDLNPHQIEAALFALESPLSKGVILADEVGLGKTIEAGIVLCNCGPSVSVGFSLSVRLRSENSGPWNSKKSSISRLACSTQNRSRMMSERGGHLSPNKPFS